MVGTFVVVGVIVLAALVLQCLAATAVGLKKLLAREPLDDEAVYSQFYAVCLKVRFENRIPAIHSISRTT
jgi:hypothetical protein